jgi:hypothetical protein
MQKEHGMSKLDRSFVIAGLFACCLIFFASASAAQVGKDALARCADFAFSTEEDFITRGPEPPDGNPIISAGDLLTSHPTAVCARNADLLFGFDVAAEVDLGLDAVDVIDVDGYIVAFSTEIDSPNQGQFSAGDLLITNLVVIPNAELTFKFSIPYDIGLDAVHFIGDVENILAVLEFWRAQGVPRGLAFSQGLARMGIDIWFSLEGTFTPAGPTVPILDGDLLSARDGTIVAKQADLFPASVPAGIPDRGVDFGLDAATAERSGETATIEFSPEILFNNAPLFVDGDALRYAGGSHMPNHFLIGGFEPVTTELGLDALSGTMGVLFADGFETGNILRWSFSVP